MQSFMRERSAESYDYYHLAPYPRWAFGRQQWPLTRGPVPTAVAVPHNVVAEGANFLFRGGPPTFSVTNPEGTKTAAIDAADAYLKQIIRRNRLGEKWASLAEACANQGAIAAKFCYDADNEACPVRISFLDIPNQCRVWCDPHDATAIVFARIQYPYRDPSSGDWYYFREEWTADTHVTYRPLRAGSAAIASCEDIPGYSDHMGDGGGADGAPWQEDTRETNPFGVIPVTVIRNKRIQGNPLGEGDLWRLFRLIDRIALTLHDSDRWNQINSRPIVAVINNDTEDEDDILPGETLRIRSDNPSAPPVDAKLIEPMGYARQWVGEYVDRIETMAWEAAGYNKIDLAAMSNKGAWTQLAFEATFNKTIATTERKRELWGNSGLCIFFDNLLTGLSRIGGIKELAGYSDDTDVAVVWPKLFTVTPQDLGEMTTRTVTQVASKFLTAERGARRIAAAEGLADKDVDALIQELEQQQAQEDAKAEAAMAAQAQAQAAPTGNTLHDTLATPQEKVHSDTELLTTQIGAPPPGAGKK
jgi:hypothetical protein